uniref:Uncharacterized protein n=1 Tax=Tetranychus urticae TaxID=32264 RepID=T1JRX0_TETUR
MELVNQQMVKFYGFYWIRNYYATILVKRLIDCGDKWYEQEEEEKEDYGKKERHRKREKVKEKINKTSFLVIPKLLDEDER